MANYKITYSYMNTSNGIEIAGEDSLIYYEYCSKNEVLEAFKKQITRKNDIAYSSGDITIKIKSILKAE